MTREVNRFSDGSMVGSSILSSLRDSLFGICSFCHASGEKNNLLILPQSKLFKRSANFLPG